MNTLDIIKAQVAESIQVKQGLLSNEAVMAKVAVVVITVNFFILKLTATRAVFIFSFKHIHYSFTPSFFISIECKFRKLDLIGSLVGYSIDCCISISEFTLRIFIAFFKLEGIITGIDENRLIFFDLLAFRIFVCSSKCFVCSKVDLTEGIGIC